jgi:biopolymer transport protein ExbD
MRIAVSQKRRKYERIVVNLASMIDISFLLLFYFMVATMLEDREKRLSTALQTQSSSASAAMDFQPQFVEVRAVDSAPAYVLGTHICRTRDELAAVLGPLPKDPGVFVKVFEGADVGFAVAAIQVARDAGFEQVTYVPAKQ